ncbi:MAG: sulfatase-like hydrolase/transferase [Bacteroidota bacterium]
MKEIIAPLRRIIFQLLFLLWCYFLSRCAFTIINIHHFAGLTLTGFFRITFFALRYDTSALLALNAIYILLLLLPLPLWRMPRWQRLTHWVFIIVNVIALLFEIGDWTYYPFNFKRSTADVLNMVTRKGDFLSILPRLILDFWYIPLIMFFMVWSVVHINKKIAKHTPIDKSPVLRNTRLAPIWQTLILLLVSGTIVIGIRGGLQYVPIGIRNAVQVADSKYTPIVINTPFSVINTFANDELEEAHYLPVGNLTKYINTYKHFDDNIFRKKNVVLIICESFSKEFTKLGGRTSYTPFLDSLMDRSLVCTHAYANALHSAEGIPAVVAGLPSMMDESISTSVYAADRITALPGLLKDKGYATAFYHGGTNGTMSFDVFCANAGFQKYYGRTEYNNEDDYDGNWGIWDEPFLQYFVAGIGKMQQPFLATAFTLTSHSPYKVPAQYAGALPKGTMDIHPCIAYTDMALRRFFAVAEKQAWYNNTLFVITADHCSPLAGDTYYQNNMGRYAIPIIFYAPGDTTVHGTHGSIAQQIDILPSVLDYLGYDQPFFAFGNSIFRKAATPYAINQLSGVYQLLINGYLLQTADVKPTGLYAFPTDSICAHNLLSQQAAITQDHVLPYLKAMIQSYRYALIHNKLYIEQGHK